MSNFEFEVKQIFDQALEIKDLQERNAWLEKTCAGRSKLLYEVARLLQAYYDAGEFLQNPSAVTVDHTDGRTEQMPLAIHCRPESLGRFQIQHELGRGGSGVVFKAFDPALRREVALKVPRGDGLAAGDHRKRFLREAEAAAALDDQHLVPVYEVGDDKGVLYIASAYCPGPDLAKWLEENNAALTARQAATIVWILASAVEHAHARGVLHRDLKPSNVLLFPDPLPARQTGGEDLPFTPRITDFGLAKLVEASWEETRTSVIVGTPLYMAPEQATGRDSDSRPQADIYSLGAILYQLLTGRTPFEGPTLLSLLDRVRHDEPIPPRKRLPAIPRELETICLKCLRKNPRDRYTSAAELAADLERFLAGKSIFARPVGLRKRLRDWSHRPERIRDAGLLAILLGCVFSIWIVFGFIGVVAQRILPEMSSQMLTHSALLVFGQLMPMAWLGVQTLRGKAYAIRLGLVLSLAAFCAGAAPLFGSVTAYSEIYDDEPYAKWMFYFLLSVMFGIQSLAYLVALRANRVNRSFAEETRPS